MLWNKNLQCSEEPIVTKSKRLNVSVVNMNTAIILMCNVYMPIYKDNLESYHSIQKFFMKMNLCYLLTTVITLLSVVILICLLKKVLINRNVT